MTNQNAGATLVKTSQAQTGQTATMAPTHPMSGSTSGDSSVLSVLETARVELKSGNVEGAIRQARQVSGECARLGNRQVAGLVRRAVWIAPFGQIESADSLLAEAATALCGN